MSTTTSNDLMSPDALRTLFSSALSSLYREEVPLYGDLVSLVNDVNEPLLGRLQTDAERARLHLERHGAIRLGTAWELATMARLFSLFGMKAVGYYDLTVAGLPVHATAFRPVEGDSLLKNPFRVFTSLLRQDLLPPATRALAQATLARRNIFTPGTLAFLDLAEKQGGIAVDQAEGFIDGTLETFRWHLASKVGIDEYELLRAASPLVADIVSFAGPHINHLTPCTLDIDAVQAGMIGRGIPPKSIIEGPPERECPILLRQTSFQALQEPIFFVDQETHSKAVEKGQHRARFGEVESRGAALTPKGRELFERCFAEARAAPVEGEQGKRRGSHVSDEEGEGTEVNDKHQAHLRKFFAQFPDSWAVLRREGLIYVRYSLSASSKPTQGKSLEALLEEGSVSFQPIIYEDFLPASAAGIFSSNIGGETVNHEGKPDQTAFEAALGSQVLDSHTLYKKEMELSLSAVESELGFKLA